MREKGRVCMTSILRKNIAGKYNLYHNQKIKTEEMKKIAQEEKIKERDFLELFDVSSRYQCLKGIACNFYIKIYSPEEIKEIKQKIREELVQIPKVNGNIIQVIKNSYRISDKDMRQILGFSYYEYKKAIEENKYIEIKEMEEEKQQEESKDCILKIKNQKKYKISKKLIMQIAKEEDMSISKVGEQLGIKKISLEKLMKEQQLTARATDNKIKYKVKKLSLDLKYLENYGERYYQEQELKFICQMYGISVDNMLYYLANGKTMYDTYCEALKNNPKGVWIGKKMRLSNQYLEENYAKINYYITYAAKNMAYLYSANYHDEQDFKSEVMEYILRNGGIYEKNLIHDTDKLNYVLIKNANFIIRNYYLKKPKELAIIIQYEDKEYENAEVLADNRYNPEILQIQEEYSYVKEIDFLHRNIVKDIKADVYFAIDHNKQCFNRIATKYNLSKESMEETLNEIRYFIIKNRLVKFDKKGMVIPMFDVDEE